MSHTPAPVFIDFEASSLDLISSYPIEVGVCFEDGSTKSWLIKPAPTWNDWSEQAEKIHQLTRQQLEEEGRSVIRVTEELNQILEGTVYCDAWTFDSFWLHRLFKAAKSKPTFQLESISMLLDADQINLWQPNRKNIINTLDLQTHRAANDAKILHETWKSLAPKAP